MRGQGKALPSRKGEKAWLWRTLWLVGGLLLWRCCYAFIVPLDLVADEAYYWSWSRQLDWCYFSKPPMIAWIIHLATQLGGHTPWVVRMPAVLLGTIGLLFIYALGSRMYGEKAGFWATAAAAATPANAAMSLIMTIDAPFMFCWSAALYAFWRLIERHRDRYLWAVITGFSVGLGLLSKQTMIVFLALSFLFLLLTPNHRIELAKPLVWLTALFSLVFLIPVVFWNIDQGWVLIHHTTGHFTAVPFSATSRLLNLAEYSASQGGIISPLTGLLVSVVIFLGLVTWNRIQKRERYLVCFSAVPLSGILMLSLFQRIEPNWPGPFYASGIVLLAGWATGKADLGQRLGCLRRFFVPAVFVGAASCVLTYSLPFALPLLGLEGSRFDPTVRLRGWHQLAQQVDEQMAILPRPNQTAIVTTTGRGLASELAFYMKGNPYVFPYNETGIVFSQYDVWGWPEDLSRKDMMLITHTHGQIPESLRKRFQRLQQSSVLTRDLGHGRVFTYQIWLGSGFQELPSTEH